MKPELPKFPAMLRKMWSGTEVQQWIDENIAPLFEQAVGSDHSCTHKWGVEWNTHNHEPAKTVCVKCGYKPDTHALNTACEPVKGALRDFLDAAKEADIDSLDLAHHYRATASNLNVLYLSHF